MGILRERLIAARLSFLLPGGLEALTGGYIYDRRIVDGLRQAGWQVEVHALDLSFPHPTAEALRHAAAVLFAIPDGSVVVIDGLALGSLPEVLQAESARLRLVGLIHHPLAFETGLDASTVARLRDSERAALAFTRRVIVTSRWTARSLAEYAVPARRVRVVEPGFDRLPARSDGGQRLPADTLQLLCVATLTPRKGHRVLFAALARLRDRSWHLSCAGSPARDPQTAAALQEQVDVLGLRDRISFLGEVDGNTLERCYAGSDVFVLASHLEGYGMALAEALARGIPVVSTLAGAIPETVPANAGLLVEPDNEAALAEALARVMDEPEMLHRLAVNARAAGAALPRWSDAAREFAAALEDLEDLEDVGGAPS